MVLVSCASDLFSSQNLGILGMCMVRAERGSFPILPETLAPCTVKAVVFECHNVMHSYPWTLSQNRLPSNALRSLL